MDQLALDFVSEVDQGRRGLKAVLKRMFGRKGDSWRLKARERRAWQQGFRAGMAKCEDTHPDLFCRWVLEYRDLDVDTTQTKGGVRHPASTGSDSTPGETGERSVRRAS